MRQPAGVAVDYNCNIYVISHYYNKVIVLSPDGKQWKQLLDQNDGLIRPYAISIEKTTNKVLITNYDGRVFLYHTS
jgi:DNA-binding beta-propeller fold protein YncE